MRYLTLLFLYSLASIFGFSQEDAPINECSGALNIFENKDYSLQFTGKNSTVIENAYPSLQEKLTGNQLWINFIAPENGQLHFDASISTGSLKMVIFKEEKGDICNEISRGIAEIQRLQLKDGFSTIGLNKDGRAGSIYSLEFLKGEKIYVMLSTDAKSKEHLSLHWNFESYDQVVHETKLLNMCDDDFAPVVKIKLKDNEDGKPLVGSISIKGHKSVAALYVCSELMINVDRKCKLLLDCEVEGYFFEEMELEITGTEAQEFEIGLERVAPGKKMILEEIEFKPGTSTITENSESRLRRLKDFLALNSELEIEIQGHVFHLGENNIAAQKMSESRARTVLKYLADNGIDKVRMTATGLGNTQPIYEEPKFSYEEQANRRVEIIIK